MKNLINKTFKAVAVVLVSLSFTSCDVLTHVEHMVSSGIIAQEDALAYINLLLGL